MVRTIGIIVGAFFSGVLLWSAGSTAIEAIKHPAEATAEHEFHKEPKELHLASDGPFGSFKNTAQLQRGFQVYKEVCSACHALGHVHFYDLKALGYNDGQVKTIAAGYQIPVYNAATGEVQTHPGLPGDTFPPVSYGGQGSPPDLSLVVKAREGGAAYVYSILTGYQAQPAELLKKFPGAKTPEGLHYNPYFANLNIAMPPPLTSDGQVTYAEGNPPATVNQMAEDVSAFLVWAAEPKLAVRHKTGLAVMIFLLMATLLGYMSYQNVWAGIKSGATGDEPKSAAKPKRAKRANA